MCSIAGVSDDIWRKIADLYITIAIERDADSHSYEINSPEHAASSGLYLFKDRYDEAVEYNELDEFLTRLGLPADFVPTRAIAKQLMPLFTEVASSYSFDSYDDEFEDW